jgi:hypothetical protein
MAAVAAVAVVLIVSSELSTAAFVDAMVAVSIISAERSIGCRRCLCLFVIDCCC